LIQLQGALCTLAALRALVEEKDRALEDANHEIGEGGRYPEDHCGRCRGALSKVRIALSLTEAEMRKRLEEK